ncbi:dihydroneopterin aldolase [Chloroherpeton thalassium ATCC 35110]|uniref:7,8-dihydroneopterin aldolase n=1 Tax=Chloroherpeton thalassium (strain ATCC 35110 / GB-78) TaxID=517418 RepID=B3QTI2_CHLT3|nr:dihydroneopterin aldolase [Chloroherpeton thalassium]ACF12728.1 dihydroneopterin aldolase [Chloroherpeton thalassium ATCC 35110]
MDDLLNRFEKKHCIRLKNAIFYAHHGVSEAESEVGNRYAVDAELYLDLSQSGQTDDLSHTIDYGTVYSRIKDMVLSSRFSLLESIAHRLAASLMAEFTQLESVRIFVRKYNPPIGGICDYAEIEYWLSQKTPSQTH